MTSQYLSFAIQFVSSVFLARWFITPAQLGLFSVAFAAITLIAFLQDFGITRYVTGERDLTPDKLHSAFTLSVTVAWSIAVFAILAAWPVSWFYGDPQLLPVTLILAASYLLVPLAIIPHALCQRRLDFRSNAMIEVGSALANACVSIVLAMRDMGAEALAWGAFAQQAARFVISQWRGGPMLPWPLRLSGSARILQLGGTNSVLSICGSVTARAPELVIGRLIDSAAVGLFSRASGLAVQLRMLMSGAISGVFFPAFRQVRDRGDALAAPYLRVVSAYTAITWPAMAGLAIAAEPLIQTLYGERWLLAAPLLAWIALSQTCFAAVPLNADIPILLGRMRNLIFRSLLDTFVSVLLLALAAPFGLLWVAASRAVHGLAWMAIHLPLMRATIGFSWRDLLAVYGKSLAATIAAILPLLASYALWQGPSGAGIGQVLGGAAAGVVCWLASLAALRHSLYDEILGMLSDMRARLSAGVATPPA